jgi:uncharacterized protein DUF4260
VVTGAPRLLLRLEGVALVVASLLAFRATGEAWWLVPAAVLLPDLTAAGYLHGPRLGSYLYNAGHVTPIPAVVAAVGWWQGNSLVLALGVIWLAHIGLDRALGYGLKYEDSFQHTHLGRIGRR